MSVAVAVAVVVVLEVTVAVKGDFICKTCAKKLKPKQAQQHHKQGHDVWYLSLDTGELTDRYGERAKAKPKPKITARGDEHILEHFKGYERDREDVVFILCRDTGEIKDMRLEYPLLHPIYELVKRDMDYGGTFPQFLADSIETLFASAGYELVLAPKQEREIYDEAARLKREGKLIVTYDDENRIRLDVNYGRQIQGSEAGAGARGDNDKASGEEGAEKEPSEPG